MNLAKVNKWIERISAIEDDVTGQHSELTGEYIEFDLTGASTERVVSE
jgi:hypothetical protein